MKTFSEWLEYLEAMHHRPIDMGLERTAKVQQQLGLDQPNAFVFTVAGTNGKGSTCAMLDSVLIQAGYRVGLYTSPHLLTFNERARIGQTPVADADFVRAFVQVEAARLAASSQDGPISLTFFEFTTLAILWLFQEAKLDAWVLEVGLGGRLDAVNVIDTNCAICTTIALDHMEFLGPDRESIGREKAGIFRPNIPAIVADPMPPQSVVDHAMAIGADLWLHGRDFNTSGDKQQWAYGGRSLRRAALAYPALRGTNQLLNASAVLAALEATRMALPVSAQAIRQGLLLVDWPGRFQVLPGKPTVVLDVGHNPHAAAHLRASLDNMGFFSYTHLILGVLADKDLTGIVQALKDKIDHWHLVTLSGPRGQTAMQLREQLLHLGIEGKSFNWSILEQAPNTEKAPNVRDKTHYPPEKTLQCYDTPAQAYAMLTRAVAPNDRIVVFGSFHTVAGVLAKPPKSSPH